MDLLGLPVPCLAHVLSFLVGSDGDGRDHEPSGSASEGALPALGFCSRRALAVVGSASATTMEGWRFLACSAQTPGQRPLRWGCWLAGARADKRFLLDACGRYHAFLSHSLSPDATLFIPRTVHHVWLGSPFPAARFGAWRESWRWHHPGWEHRLWTEAEVADHFPEGLRNQAAYEAAANFGEKADILRLEILNRFGGLYVDVDMECLRGHDELHRGACGFYAGFSRTATVELNNGVLGCAPGHPLLARMMARIGEEHAARARTRQPPSQQQEQQQLASILGFLGQGEAASVTKALSEAERHQAAMGTIERTGPGLLTRVCAEYLSDGPAAEDQKESDVLLLPPQWFYPLPNDAHGAAAAATKEVRAAGFVVPGVTHAVHHWARSWCP